MKYLISYSSLTCNTQSLAEYIRIVLPPEDCLFFGRNYDVTDEIIANVDILFIGFWTDKGSCDEDTAELVKRVREKNIALFGTAGFGASQQYFQRILSLITPLVDKSCKMVQPFVCLGKIAQEILMRYTDELKKDPENERIIRLIKNYKIAKTHPDSKDFTNLSVWAKSAINSFER